VSAVYLTPNESKDGIRKIAKENFYNKPGSKVVDRFATLASAKPGEPSSASFWRVVELLCWPNGAKNETNLNCGGAADRLLR
jgi:hypothetical protein